VPDSTDSQQEQPHVPAPDTYPRQYARTRRFSCGEPRSFEIVDIDGQPNMVFLRSLGGSDPVNCLWRVAVNENGTLGPEQLLVNPAQLAFATDDDSLPAEELSRRERMREQASGITGYSLSKSGLLATFTLSGQVAIADLTDTSSPAHVRLLDSLPGAFDARLSPDGEFVAYVCDGDLHVIHVAGADVVLAHDDDAQVTWGMADFNAAEEFDRYRGYWWSPDSTQLLVARVDNNPVPVWWISDPAHPDRKPTEHRYPAAGADNAIVSLWIIGTDGVKTLIDSDAVHPEMEYLLAASWTDQGITITTLDRSQTDQRVIAVAPDGTCAELHSVTDPVWVELIPGTPRRTPVGVIHTADVSDGADGRRVLTRTSDGSTIEVTPSNLLVNSVPHVQENGSVLCSVTNRNVGSQFTQLIAVSATGEVDIIAGGSDDLGIHAVAAATDRAMVIRSTSLDRTRAEHRVFIGGREVGQITSLAEIALVNPQPTFLQAGIRGIPVAVFLPSDPLLRSNDVKLPVVMDPYGGPHAARVVASRNAHASSQWLADQGFAVVVVDGRGTPGIGPVYERSIHGDFAGPVLADQVVGLLEAAAHTPQLDLSRVGIRGWSFGGYLAALAVLRRPDVFHCAVAGAPVIDWRLYDTGYTERYLGDPTEDDAPYETSSLLTEAASLTRPIQLIHGLADDNVVSAHTLRFSSALVAAGVPHEVLPLSGVTHMTPQEEVAENLLLLQVDFLRRNLGGPTGV
jgi:dipeptidyl-peptidase 4